jgi:hypothetical protein
VPFLDTAVKVRQISWFSAQNDAAASALHVTNDTAQTLPAGTLSVFADGGFAGEALLPRSKPRESHLLGYGVDLDVELQRDPGMVTETSRLLKFVRDRLEHHYVRARSEQLSITNRSRGARTVYVQLQVSVDNARIEGAAELGREGNEVYAVLEVPGGKEVSQTIQIEEGLKRSFDFAELTALELRRFAAAAAVVPNQRAKLRRAAEQLTSAAKRRGALPKRQAELEQALADIGRVRENARILGAVRAEQVAVMAARVVELEARVSSLRSRITELAAEAEAFDSAAKRELAGL